MGTVLVLVVGIVGMGWHKRRARDAAQARLALELAEAERQRSERPRQACQLTRERIQRGSVVSPLDAEGWLVELTLWRRTPRDPVATSALLAPFVAQGHIVWPNVPELASEPTGPGRVRVEEGAAVGANGDPWERLQLVIEGPYVNAYFDQGKRAAFLRFAQALAREFDSTYAGLYARCASGTTHHLGAWFEGPSAAHALASLAYFMGRFAEVPHLRPERLQRGQAPLAPPALLDELRQGTRSFTRPRAAELLHDLGSVSAGTQPDRVAISFPLNDANRATRASLRVAEQLGWAPRH